MKHAHEASSLMVSGRAAGSGTLSALLAGLVGLLLVAVPAGRARGVTFETSHPRIFLTAEKIQTLRARVGAAGPENPQYRTHFAEYGEVKVTADRYSASDIAAVDGLNMGRLGIANAFVYLMEGGDAYFQKAKVVLDRISSLGSDDKSHYGFFVACILFDWLYDRLTNTERAAYANDIISYVQRDTFYNLYSSLDPYYNARKYVSAIFALAGQAVANEAPETAAEFVRRSIAAFERLAGVQTEICRDGFIYPIGQATYSDESGWQPLLRLLAGLKLAGVSGPEIDAIDFSVMSRTAYGEIYALVRDNYVVGHNDGYEPTARRSRSAEGPFYSAILATLHEGQEIGRIVNYLQSTYSAVNISEKPFTYLGSILFNDKLANASGSTVPNLPLTRMFDDTVLVYRSGWTGLKQDNDEILFNFTAEKHVNGHTHYAKGHFDIWRGYDPLAFMSGNYCNTGYQHYLYFGDSLAHNVMLIRNPAENAGVRPNDGGQLTNQGEGAVIGMHSSSAWSELGHTEEGGRTYTGTIRRSAVGDDHFYAYFHYPTAYSASKVRDISRSAVRLDDFFIILDRVDGVSASYPKRWLLHTIGRPTIAGSGSWDGGSPPDGNGGTPGQTSSSARLLRMDEGDSTLFVRSVFPSAALLRRVGGSADYRWYSYNENNNYAQGAPSGDRYGNWRTEIESATGAEDDVFLTVLHPAAVSGTMPPVRSLSGPNYRGVQIDAEDRTLVAVFSSSVNEATRESSYTFSVEAQGTVRVLLADLEAGLYDVYRDGSVLTTAQVSSSSTLNLTAVNGGGAFQVVRAGEAPPISPPLNLRIVP